MTIARKIGSLITQYASRDERIQSWLELPEWTPAMGALIVFGVAPLLDCIDIPDNALDFDGKPVTNASSSALFNARKLLAQWEDWQKDTGFTEFAMSPYEFIEWCIDEGVESQSFSLLRSLTNCSEPGYFAAIPSPLNIPLATQSALAPATSTQSSTNSSSESITDESRPANSSPAWQEYIVGDQSLTKHLLSTSSLAEVFEGIGLWTSKQRWTNNLPDQAWAHEARRIHGATRRSSYWDPVAFAVLVHFRRCTDLGKLTEAFDNKEALRPWRSKWRRFVAELNEWS